jgi:hypothetical protein
MGTHSATIFYDDQDKPICAIYRQYDGYPEGHGIDLAKLANKRIINGYTLEQERNGGYANGMGDLAAQVIAGLKNDLHHKMGGVYMTDLDDRQEYNYHVRPNKLLDYKFGSDERSVIITIDDEFTGSPQELLDKYSKK